MNSVNHLDGKHHALTSRILLSWVLICLILSLAASVARAQSYIRIKNVGTGFYLYENDGKVVYGIPSCFDQTAQWIMASDGAGHYRFQNRASGDYMNIQHQLDWIQCNAGSLNWGSEKWNWVLASNNQYQIQNVFKPTEYANLDGEPGYVECSTVQNGDSLSLFTIETVEGATPPFSEYEAESGTYTPGRLMSSSLTVGQPTAECSNREAVALTNTSDFVQWVSQAQANSVVVRLSVPDTAQGGGTNYTLDLYTNNTFAQAIPVTSVYSWLYGDELLPSESPSQGTPMHMFDEAQVMLGSTIPAGTIVKLQKDAANSAAFYYIDLIDLEQVPAPLTEPTNFYSITQAGASTNSADNTTAIKNAYNTAKAGGMGLWIPPGVYLQSGKVSVSGITISGAGMWYSKLLSTGSPGVPSSNNGAGFSLSTNTHLSDLAVFGNVTDRNYGLGTNTSPPGINGACGPGTTLTNVWVEHAGIGMALGGAGNGGAYPDGTIISNCRVRDLVTDGIHIYGGATNCLIVNTTTRTTGDDGQNFDSIQGAVVNSTFTNCTSQLPWRAACFADYGGSGNTFANCEASDPLTYPGLTVDAGFSSTNFGPAASTFENINLYRCGGVWEYYKYGALWVDASTSDIPSTANINITNIDVINPSNSGIDVACDSGTGYTQAGVTFNGITVNNAGTYGIYIDPWARGSGTYDNVLIYNSTSGALDNAAGSHYTITKGPGNNW
jgi:hypothetical protein